MTGSRFPGSRVIASDHLPRDLSVPSGIYGRQLSAYSCGGSRGFAHRSARTAFPWLALAGTTGHKRGIRSCRECRIGCPAALLRQQAPAKLPRGHTDDRLMPSSKTPIWRNEIDALAFQPWDHPASAWCIVARSATLLRATPSPQQCVEFFNAHQEAFQAAARAKLLRAQVANDRELPPHEPGCHPAVEKLGSRYGLVLG